MNRTDPATGREPVRGRYAPSPTGELHLGNARTALAAWLGARSTGGRFVLRVEDLDPPRVVAGARERQLDDLRWLGLDWDEGPDVGGPYAPYVQSERFDRYREALDLLARAGRVYACDCTRAQIRGNVSAPHGPGGEGPRYAGTCRERGLPLEIDRVPRAGDRCPALRLRVEPGEVCFDDLVAGRACQDVAADVGDFILKRADGLFTYQLAVVLDDAAMQVNQIVRGADLLASTARQIALQRAVGAPPVAYAHVGLVVGADGERLAKRDRAATLGALRAAGADSRRVVGEMARSLGLLESPERVSAAELVGSFAWSRAMGGAWRVAPEVEERLPGR